MKKLLDHIFRFTKTERTGILTILVLTGCYLWVLVMQQQLRAKLGKYSFEQFKKEIEEFERNNRGEDMQIEKIVDLNALTSQDVINLGGSQQVANRMVKYRSSIGGFTHKNDLLDVYGMDTTLYRAIVRSTFIMPQSNTDARPSPNRAKVTDQPRKVKGEVVKTDSSNSRSIATKKPAYPMDSASHVKEHSITPISAPVIPIDVNRASAEEWQKLYGIGPAYSKWIVQYRDALGGFYDISQVKETYRLPDSVFTSIADHLKLEPNSHYQMSVHQLRLDDLVNHPYLNYREARVIFNYLQQHQPLEDITDLRNIMGLDTAVIDRMLPYFTLAESTSN